MTSDRKCNIQVGEPFPESAQAVLNALYSGQKSPPQNDRGKIELMERLLEGFIPDHFESEEQTRKAYELAYLTKIQVL